MVNLYLEALKHFGKKHLIPLALPDDPEAKVAILSQILDDSGVSFREITTFIESMSPWLDRPKRQVPKYPWVHLGNNGFLRKLGNKESPLQAANFYREYYSAGLADTTLVRDVWHWMRTGRRLIEVSPQSLKVLLKMARERKEAGLHPARWSSIPTPGSPLYGQSLAFSFQSRESGNVDLFVFTRPIGDVANERFETSIWKKDAAGWAMPPSPTIVTKDWFHQDSSDSNFQNVKRVLTIVINLLAAMSTRYDVEIFTKSGKKGRKTHRGGIRSVRTLRLDPDGLSTWAYRYVRESKTHKDEVRPRPRRDTEGTGESLSMHYRNATMTRKWVLEAHVRPGEYVEKTRERNGKTLYCVFRPKKGGMVGEELKVSTERLTSGIDDINTKKGT